MNPAERCCGLIHQEPAKNFLEWLELLRKLWKAGDAAHCGAPATVQTAVGPMCEPCAQRFEEKTREGSNLLGLLRNVASETPSPPRYGPEHSAACAFGCRCKKGPNIH